MIEVVYLAFLWALTSVLVSIGFAAPAFARRMIRKWRTGI